MTSKLQAVILRIKDFDLTNLPKEYRDANAPGFRQAVKDYLMADYAGLFAKIAVDDECIRIDRDVDATDQFELALKFLQQGIYSKGKAILKSLLSSYPMNAVVLFNLGMIYSDEGNLKQAIDLLTKATEANHAHAWVALAVAYTRKGNLDKAMESAQSALKVSPDDPYALRTAANLIGDTKQALGMLEKASQIAPNDSLILYSLAECLRNTDENKQKVDEIYKRVIELSPGTEHAERAKGRLSEFAYERFRKMGELRPDAVMYCLDALQKFSTMTHHDIAGVAMETATLGQGGLNVADPYKLYQLRTIPGSYTGLNVVCILHTAIQKVSPDNNSGFDIQVEYEEALKLFNKRNYRGRYLINITNFSFDNLLAGMDIIQFERL